MNSLALAAVPNLPISFHTRIRFGVLDQGQTPKCVGFSGALGRYISERYSDQELLHFDGDDLYAQAKLIDGAPNEDGTDIRSACKVLAAKGALVLNSLERKPIAAYARLLSVNDIKQAVRAYDSAWIGASWYESWFDPEVNGTLPAPDQVAGGHAFTIIGWDDTRGAFRIQNSWGPNWGLHGTAWLLYSYLDWADIDVWRMIDVVGDR